ncbi:hypothetical protein ACVWZR_002226 [Bradyrhizobium sp. i1.3.1]
MEAEPFEDLQALLERDSLAYAFQRLGEVYPERADLGTVGESDEAKAEGGRNRWDRHKNDVKEFVCLSETIRKEGPLRVVQAIFGVLAHAFGGAIATYATVILIKKQFGSTINNLGKDALDAWCGDIKPAKTTRTAKASKGKKSVRKRK